MRDSEIGERVAFHTSPNVKTKKGSKLSHTEETERVQLAAEETWSLTQEYLRTEVLNYGQVFQWSCLVIHHSIYGDFDIKIVQPVHIRSTGMFGE